MPASVGRTPLELRCSSRVESSPSSRLICWLSAEGTTPSAAPAETAVSNDAQDANDASKGEE